MFFGLFYHFLNYYYCDLPVLFYAGGMSSMIGLPSDHALVEDDECLRFHIS